MALVEFCSIHELIAMFCSIDQLLVGFFSIYEPVFVSVAAVAGTFVGLSGLGKWKEEIAYRANVKLARRLMKAAYRVRDELAIARNPSYSIYELCSVEEQTKQEILTEQEKDIWEEAVERINSEAGESRKKANAWKYEFSKRMEPVNNAVEEFKSLLNEAEFLWGDAIMEKGSKLLATVSVLKKSGKIFIIDIESGGEDFSKDKKLGKKIRTDISSSSSVDNPLSNDIEEAIKDLKSEARLHLKRRQSFTDINNGDRTH